VSDLDLGSERQLKAREALIDAACQSRKTEELWRMREFERAARLSPKGENK
jgi:hypothetical protein